MARFISSLRAEKECLENCSDKVQFSRWRLTSPLAYKSDLLDDSIVVPEGFSTDYASIPRLPVVYWLAGNLANAPAVLHDWMYSNHWVTKGSKLLADKIFKEAMDLTKDPPSAWKRLAFYHSVLWLGWIAWNRGGRTS